MDSYSLTKLLTLVRSQRKQVRNSRGSSTRGLLYFLDLDKLKQGARIMTIGRESRGR
ncbi:hypothetical protein T3H97_25480 [Paenibacillus sp. LX16]|uniref:hypothetical protein n=1 Tax=Paenibacillus sp. LX16 TaxID=1740264 RepID=UPI002E28AA46|nr:hypothetical protein [Paenibacillus sp. LX16]